MKRFSAIALAMAFFVFLTGFAMAQTAEEGDAKSLIQTSISAQEQANLSLPNVQFYPNPVWDEDEMIYRYGFWVNAYCEPTCPYLALYEKDMKTGRRDFIGREDNKYTYAKHPTKNGTKPAKVSAWNLAVPAMLKEGANTVLVAVVGDPSGHGKMEYYQEVTAYPYIINGWGVEDFNSEHKRMYFNVFTLYRFYPDAGQYFRFSFEGTDVEGNAYLDSSNSFWLIIGNEKYNKLTAKASTTGLLMNSWVNGIYAQSRINLYYR